MTSTVFKMTSQVFKMMSQFELTCNSFLVMAGSVRVSQVYVFVSVTCMRQLVPYNSTLGGAVRPALRCFCQ